MDVSRRGFGGLALAATAGIVGSGLGTSAHAAPGGGPAAEITHDRTIDPDLQRFLAHRMGARTIELDTSHVSLITRPREVATLILAAAGIAV